MKFANRVEPVDNCGVGVAFTTRDGGVSVPPYDSLNLGRGGDDPAASQANLERVRAELGLTTLIGLRQVHGTTVIDVGASAGGVLPAVADADGLVTADHQVGLLVRAADCVPILLADAAAGVVGAAHCGRVGLLAGIVEAVVTELQHRGATALTAWIGPHICPACYEVPTAMAEAAWLQRPATRARSSRGTPSLDLGAGVAVELERLGCAEVVRWDRCTAESPDLFSYRRDSVTGRLGGIIWLA